MMNAATDPEKDPPQPDEFESLEQLRQRVKEKQDAWRKLLESLEQMKKTDTEITEPQQPAE